MTGEITINSLSTSTHLDTEDIVSDALIVSPSYVLRSASQAMARENFYSKEEEVFKLETSLDGTFLQIDSFVGYIKGNIGIHFVEIKAPLILDTSSLLDGKFKIILFVEYFEHKTIEASALTKLLFGIYPNIEDVDGTELLTFNILNGAVDAGSITPSIVNKEVGSIEVKHEICEYSQDTGTSDDCGVIAEFLVGGSASTNMIDDF